MILRVERGIQWERHREREGGRIIEHWGQKCKEEVNLSKEYNKSFCIIVATCLYGLTY